MAGCAWKSCPRRAASCARRPEGETDVFAEARLTNLIANLLALLAVLAIVVGAVVWTIRRPYFSIARIELAPMAGSTLQYVTPLSLQTALAGPVRGEFFLFELDAARRRPGASPSGGDGLMG